ncbi:MAG: LPS-assembly protein LptD [Verrucomicrobia bacterium]|nr:LPS-assembly protein LptD [Verrucomicrobiota bacterium]
MRRLIVLLFVCLGMAAPLVAQDQEKAVWTIESAEGEIDVNIETGMARATNGVVVKYGDAMLSAREATLNQNTGEVTASGSVRLERQGAVWTGDTLQYNFITGKIIARNFKGGQIPYFVSSGAMVGDQRAGLYVGAQSSITTDDFAKPGYSVRAKSVVVSPGESIVARNATLYLGNTPVFYFPYYRRSLRQSPNRWTLTPGYRSLDGAYLLTAYQWYWSERLDGALHLDGRTERGVGLGPDVNWHLSRWGDGGFKYYYIHDLDPGVTEANEPIDPDRQRVWFAHQAAVTSNLTAKTRVRWQADSLVLRDYFESEYQRDPEPSSHAEVQQQWPNYTLNLLAQPRLNKFQAAVEQLPDLQLSGLRQQLGRSAFFYDSDTHLGWYRRRYADDATNAYSAFRADTYHQVLLPHTFFNWLNVAPRIGARFTHYGESDPEGRSFPARDRGVFHAGMEMTFKASRVWPGVRSRFWQVNGLRHVIEPGLNYAYVPRPNRTPDELAQFHYEVPTTRLLPIEYPQYNAIDSIDSQNVLRLSLRNRLQTKRPLGIEDVVHWALMADWRLKPRRGQTTFSDVYSQLDLVPFSWLALTSDLRYGLHARRLREANHGLTLTPNTTWSVNFSHRYMKDDFSSGLGVGNDLYTSTLYYRVNENWGARAHLRYEARENLLEEQQYSLYHDFRSWTGALTLRFRESRSRSDDFTIAFTFSLKAYPRFGLGDDLNRPSLLLGY